MARAIDEATEHDGGDDGQGRLAPFRMSSRAKAIDTQRRRSVLRRRYVLEGCAEVLQEICYPR